MYSRRSKYAAFTLEGLNAFATSLYFTYLFFLLRQEFGFTNLGNLVVCAANGFIYAFAAWFGGQIGQRAGYFHALRIGFSLMGLSLLAGAFVHTVTAHVLVMAGWTLGMCLTWPNLEAIVSEHEPRSRLKNLIGAYNVIWATSSGVASFVGGAILEHFGRSSIFFIPVAIHAVQACIAFSNADPVRPKAGPASEAVASHPEAEAHERPRGPLAPQVFLKMAWVANPFAYVAINALLPVIPKVAEKFALSPMFAGFFCYAWFFARALSFVGLWFWDGWHYKVGWLVAAQIALAVSFAVMLLSQSLVVLLVAQLVLGVAVGLIYYSSLFYSMDVGDTKGEHGGIHEAAIGLGIFLGPATGAASLALVPQNPNVNVWAVTLFLLLGLGTVLVLRQRGLREGRAA